MGSLVLAAHATYPVRPERLFELFGSSSEAGWLFDARCDSLMPGAPVSINLPLSGRVPTERVCILGRISRMHPDRLIVIRHDQPWSGSLQVRFEPVGATQTRVTVAAELDEEGMSWLMRWRGFPTRVRRDASVHRIGLLTTKSGPGAVFAVACENLARMAVEEVNACGGLLGRPVELLVGDDATNPAHGVFEAQRLIDAGCRVIVASVTSATFEAVARTLSRRRIPLIHPLLNEGGGGAGHVLRWGERPKDQLRAAARPFMKSTSARRWFLIGNDYSWSHGAHAAARRVLAPLPGGIIDEHFVALGTEDFSEVMDRIQRSGADCILSTLVGADEVAFERQSWAAGLRERCSTLSLALDESTREHIGEEAGCGLWTAFGYFQQLDNENNAGFLERYRDRYGPWAPPVSTLSESVYDATHLYAGAVRACRDDDPAAVVRTLHDHRAHLPRGSVTLVGPHYVRQEIHVAEATRTGFRLLQTTG